MSGFLGSLLERHTNHAPSPMEKTQLKQLVVQVEADLLRLESEIEEAEARVAMLHELRAKRRERFRIYVGLLSPIRRLPPELLAEIFCHYLDIIHNDRVIHLDPDIGGGYPDAHPALLLIGICSSWRRIGMAMPKLWTHTSLTFERKRLFYPALDWFSAQLTRARPGPVSVDIRNFNHRQLPWNALSQLLSPHLDMIQILRLDFPMDAYKDMLPPITDEHPTPCKVLRKVVLRGEEKAGMRLLDIHLPWSQLTTLDIWSLTFPAPQCISMLTQCKSLLQCSIAARPWRPTEIIVTPTPTVLPALTSLVIRFSGDGRTGELFDAFTLPSLKSLDVSTWGNRSAWANGSYLNFKTRSTLDLSSLSLNQCQCHASDLIAFVQNMPSLTTLDTEDSRCNDMHLVNALTYSNLAGRKCFAPNLRALTSTLSGVQTAGEMESILCMLESRCPGELPAAAHLPAGRPKCLELVDLDLDIDSWPSAMKLRMTLCRSNGMIIM